MSLELTNISKSFGAVEVLNDINITIDEGDFLVLLGASGCGKSTLLNCIAGLESVSGGELKIKGQRVNEIDASVRNVAMVFQSYALYPTMKVERNISFALECQGVPKAERKLAVERVAKLLHISDLLDRKPGQLSGGQRQRVAIGRALVRNPAIFLLDEPMSNLDAKLRNKMRSELRDLHKELGATFILVTHDQIEAMSMATKVAVLDQGKVQQFGTPFEIYHRPNNLFVAAFVGQTKMNFLYGQYEMHDGNPSIRVGQSLIPLNSYEFTDKPKQGSEIVLGIRPEDIYEAHNIPSQPNHFITELVATERELTGGDTNVGFSFQGHALRCRYKSARMPEIGTLQKLAFDLTNCAVFDAATELRV